MKSRMDRKFSRIENLWPRDGSCPLPLRSKRIFNKCFRIVKTQKTSRGCSAHLMGSPFAPNAVPAPVCAAALSGSLTESVRSWRSISFRRLIQDSRCGMKKAGRSADTTSGFFQAQEQRKRSIITHQGQKKKHLGQGVQKLEVQNLRCIAKKQR